jgi:hypothetical protein
MTFHRYPDLTTGRWDVQRSYYFCKVMAHLSSSDDSFTPMPDQAIMQVYHSMRTNGVIMDKYLLNATISALGEYLRLG